MQVMLVGALGARHLRCSLLPKLRATSATNPTKSQQEKMLEWRAFGTATSAVAFFFVVLSLSPLVAQGLVPSTYMPNDTPGAVGDCVGISTDANASNVSVGPPLTLAPPPPALPITSPSAPPMIPPAAPPPSTPPRSPPPANSSLLGIAFSTEAQYGEACAEQGAVSVQLMRSGSVVASAATEAGGTYRFHGLEPGLDYTLVASAGSPLLSRQLTLVETPLAVSLLNNAVLRRSMPLIIHCLTRECPTDVGATRLILSWEASVYDNLDLRLSFALTSSSQGQRRQCEVWAGRPNCGHASWQASSDVWKCGSPQCSATVLERPVTDAAGTFSCAARMNWVKANLGPMDDLDACRRVAGEFPDTTSGCGLCQPESGVTDEDALVVRARTEMITISRWSALGEPYLATIGAPTHLCHGYNQPSVHGSSITCVGNCQTGKGYCYARGSVCLNCVLWLGSRPGADAGDSVAHGEVVCPAGEAQGGLLPFAEEWQYSGCADLSQYSQGSSTPTSAGGRRLASHAIAAPCASQVYSHAQPDVFLVREGELLHSIQPAPESPHFVDAPLHAAAAFCIDPSAHPIAEAYPAGFMPFDEPSLAQAKMSPGCFDMYTVAVGYAATLGNATTNACLTP